MSYPECLLPKVDCKIIKKENLQNRFVIRETKSDIYLLLGKIEFSKNLNANDYDNVIERIL